tara:strand:- start:561 stop:1025 length:465 start_codon:yes stop_codon:yes gene_type:complete
MKWKEILKEDKLYYWAITGQKYTSDMHGKWWSYGYIFSSRREAFDDLKEQMSKGNPRPWTVEGNMNEGHAVVYDGAAHMIMAPSYYYIIVEISDKEIDMDDRETAKLTKDELKELLNSLPEPATHRPYVDTSTPSRVMDRIHGKEYTPHDEYTD